MNREVMHSACPMKNLTATICLTIAVLLGSVATGWGADFTAFKNAVDQGDKKAITQEGAVLTEQVFTAIQREDFNTAVELMEALLFGQDFKTQLEVTREFLRSPWGRVQVLQEILFNALALMGRLKTAASEYISSYSVTETTRTAQLTTANLGLTGVTYHSAQVASVTMADGGVITATVRTDPRYSQETRDAKVVLTPDIKESSIQWSAASDLGSPGGILRSHTEFVSLSKHWVTPIKFLRLWVEKDSAVAKLMLGLFYVKYPKYSSVEAMDLIRESGEQGYPPAQVAMGDVMSGRLLAKGQVKNFAAAMKWYQLALMQGWGLPASRIAGLYGRGDGVPKNSIAKYAYMSVARALGDRNAQKAFDKSERSYTEYERANGQTMAAEIWAKIHAAKTNKPEEMPNATAKKKGSTGTGFFINAQGHIVTNSHVVKDCKQINTLYQGSKVRTSLVTNDPRNDLALLKVSTRPTAIAYFRSGRGIRAGEDILAFGYPFKSVLSDDLKGTKGMVNALAGFGNDTRFMQISAPVQPGNSGGPLLDHSGNVVGVVTARIDAAKMLKERGKIPQNVNFAIKASLVRDMLEVKDIDYETASSRRELKTVDIFDKAKKFTVLVECLQ